MKVNMGLLRLIASKIVPGSELKVQDITTDKNKEKIDYELLRLEKQGFIKCMSRPFQGQTAVISILEITFAGEELLEAE